MKLHVYSQTEAMAEGGQFYGVFNARKEKFIFNDIEAIMHGEETTTYFFKDLKESQLFAEEMKRQGGAPSCASYIFC